MTKDIGIIKINAMKTKKTPNLKKIVDPLIYRQVRYLNDMGIETEHSCAATGKSVNYNGKIETKEMHSGDKLPYIITTGKIDKKSKIILGLIMVNSPEIYYCKEEGGFRCSKSDRYLPKCRCSFENYERKGVFETHQFFKLIDVYDFYYGRKCIAFGKNLEAFLCEKYPRESSLPTLRIMFLKTLKKILREIEKQNIYSDFNSCI